MGKAEIGKAVIGMLKGGKIDMDALRAFAASPFGESIKDIMKLIDEELIPPLEDAHKINQDELDTLAAELGKCDTTRLVNIGIADESKEKYEEFGPLHKTCREGEAGKKLEQTECYNE